MIDLLAIKDLIVKHTTDVTRLILKEVEEFKKRENTDDKYRITFEVIEPIVLSALGGVMSIFVRLQYKKEDVVELTKMLYDQYSIVDSALYPRKNIEPTLEAKNEEGLPKLEEFPKLDNKDISTVKLTPLDKDLPTINVKKAKGIN